MMKRIIFLYFSMVMILAMTACAAKNAQSSTSSDFQSGLQGSKQASLKENSQNDSKSDSSYNSGISDGSSSDSTVLSSGAATSSSSAKPTVSASVSPTPTGPSGTPVTFNDALCEKLLRDCIKKPTGTCYISDFSDFSRNDTSSVYFEYIVSSNKTTLFNSYSEVHAEVTGIPASFSVLSQIPVRSMVYICSVPSGRDDVALTFDMSWIAASKEIVSFAFKWPDYNILRTTLEQHMTFSNFSTLSGCSKLKTLFLWDCKGVSLAPLAGLQNLEVLSIVNCNITSIEALRNAPKLWKLDICYNDVTDFTPLASLPALKEVTLAAITVPVDVDTLVTCPNLERLTLYDCIALTTEQKTKLSANGITFREE